MTDQINLNGLVWHLQYNFDPPYPPEVAEIAVEAIDTVNSGDCESLITLPSGEVVTAQEVIDDLRLDFYLECKPAKPEQYHDLKLELEGIGYELNIIKRRRLSK